MTTVENTACTANGTAGFSTGQNTSTAPAASEREHPTVARVKDIGSSIENDIVADRRYFHEHPELSGKEERTSEILRAKLDKLGIPYRRVGNAGLIATIKGAAPDAYNEDGTPRRRIALRSDMDALPVTELTELPYASKNPGVMHACGHDCHMAMLLGAARILSEMREELHGEVRLLFQPAEEISSGSRELIAAGALDGVDTIYGTHIWSEVDAGTISCAAGQRMASTDWFRIDIEGVSAHGSMPHKGVDAVVVASEIVVALQVLVSRDISPFEPLVVTVGEIHGGTARNIMAGSAYLTGTVRTWSNKTRDAMPERLERLCERSARAFGAKATLTYENGNGGLSNDPDCAARAEQAVVKLFGKEAVADYEGTLAGEDFSEYLRFVPGVFVFLGCRNPEIGAVHPQHSCYYTVDEGVLANGAMLAAQYALDYLAE